ncbi:MAG: ATP phosphoribosyltransferase regulatory subunit [Caldilineaceae bacterium]
MHEQQTFPTPIPSGVADYFGEDARRRRQLESTLLDSFRSWGYQDVIPPTFEFADTLASRTSEQLRAETYRFLDRDGSTLALRPEMTVAVARLVGTRLHDWPMPLRFCYAGSVYRYAQLQGGRQREFWQAGVELIGQCTPKADAEVLALTCQALQAAGLTQFRLALGQMAYFDGLLEALQLDQVTSTALHQAIDRNSEAELLDFLRKNELTTEQRRAVETLPTLSGDHAEVILERAAAVALNKRMKDAIDELHALLAELSERGVQDYIQLDLTEIHNLGYYTGITFEALAPQLGFPLASGGRYDNLVGTFGKAQPAVGVAITLDWLLMALKNKQSADNEARSTDFVTIALPKGRMADQSLHLLTQAGISPPAAVNDRQLVVSSADGSVSYIMAKPSDVPTFVEYGAADIGICGLDVLRESGRTLYEPLLLPFGQCRLSLAGPDERPDRPLRHLTQAKVATKYPRLAGEFFRQRGINAEIIYLNGSVELAPLVGLADFIVDMVETGETLRANGLAEFRTLLESQAVLITNRAAQRLKWNKMQTIIDKVRQII